jgi:hypothetical protein
LEVSSGATIQFAALPDKLGDWQDSGVHALLVDGAAEFTVEIALMPRLRAVSTRDPIPDNDSNLNASSFHHGIGWTGAWTKSTRHSKAWDERLQVRWFRKHWRQAAVGLLKEELIAVWCSVHTNVVPGSLDRL